MPRPRSSMRKIREALRLRFEEERSHKAIATSLNVGESTVRELLLKAKAVGLPWPLPPELSDADLEAKLYKPRTPARIDAIDFEKVEREMRSHKHMTIALVWEEYVKGVNIPASYSHFCDLYREWRKLQKLSMRQVHRAGEKTFKDFAGDTIPLFDRESGQRSGEAQLFIAVLGASSFIFAHALASQSKDDWIAANCRAAEFFGGVTELQVPDNLKSAVTKADFYDPDLNRTYFEWARHYGTTVIPARSRKPKDKPKAESGVLQAERWILARLRKERFYDIAEINAAIRAHLDWINGRVMKHMGASRRELFETLDKPALKPLPRTRYEPAVYKKVRVNIDYHVEFEKVFYSVPYALVGRMLEVRATRATVDVLEGNILVASHPRKHKKGDASTLPAHMPSHHRFKGEWTPQRLIAWAAKVGPNVEAVAETMLTGPEHPEVVFRACLGLIRLEKRFGRDRTDAACATSLAMRIATYRHVKKLLNQGTESQPTPAVPLLPALAATHDNIRGSAYFK
jgi:transposase